MMSAFEQNAPLVQSQSIHGAEKRIALFAHHDRDGVIDEYVIYYLKALKAVTSRILFVSDCALAPCETDKLGELAELVFAGNHGEYDFGSWKLGLAHLNYDLSDWAELIIANDSCFAPIYPFSGAFESVASCDFWGATSEPYNRVAGDWGIQPDAKDFNFINSYFVVFRKPILDDPAFLDFWRSVIRQNTKAAVIDWFEVGLTRLLCGLGYRYEALAERAALLFYPCNLPWARKMIFTVNGECITDLDEKLWTINATYPRQLVDSYVLRVLGHLPYRAGGENETTLAE